MAGLLYHQYRGLNELERTLKVLTKAGFGPLSEPFEAVSALRGKLLGQLGLKAPKPMSLLKLLAGLSPGTIKVWHDAESGWFSEAREKPGAPPVYQHISDEVAMAILKGELTHELEMTLMTPDEYLGE